MYRGFGAFLATAAALVFVLAGCQPIQRTGAAAGAQEITLYVGPELVDCVGVAPQKCMLVKENQDDEYRYFYGQIEGFEFEPGYNYELRVRVEPVANAPADASSLKYTLLELVSKVPAATGAAPTGTVTLEGPTWRLTSVAGADGTPLEVPAEVEATATFADGMVGGNAGCNNYGASYTLDGDRLTITPGPMTMMACMEPAMTIEQSFVAALMATAAYSITPEGSLDLLDAGGQTVATFAVLEPMSLTGVTWTAIAYNNGKEAVLSVSSDTEITVVFGEDGRLAGSAGCNRYNAAYTVDGSSIAIKAPASTRMACPPPVMEQEAAYLAALTTAATFSIQGDQLELRTADGALAVSFVATAE